VERERVGVGRPPLCRLVEKRSSEKFMARLPKTNRIPPSLYQSQTLLTRKTSRQDSLASLAQKSAPKLHLIPRTSKDSAKLLIPKPRDG